MQFLVYSFTAILVFFPAFGFIFLKSASKETRSNRSARFSSVSLFALQILSFLCAANAFLTGSWRNGEQIILFIFLGFYAIDLIAFMLIFLLPESCYADQIIERLLHFYIVLFIFLFIAGLFLAPVLNKFIQL